MVSFHKMCIWITYKGIRGVIRRSPMAGRRVNWYKHVGEPSKLCPSLPVTQPFHSLTHSFESQPEGMSAHLLWDTSNSWRHFWLSRAARCYCIPVGRGQGCCWTPYNTQGSYHNKESSSPKCQKWQERENLICSQEKCLHLYPEG